MAKRILASIDLVSSGRVCASAWAHERFMKSYIFTIAGPSAFGAMMIRPV